MRRNMSEWARLKSLERIRVGPQASSVCKLPIKLVEMMRSRSIRSRQWMMPGRQLEANEELENITWLIRTHAAVKL